MERPLHKAMSELEKGGSPEGVHAILSVLSITGTHNPTNCKDEVLCKFVKKYVKFDGITFYGGVILIWKDENPHIKPKQEYWSKQISIKDYPNIHAFQVWYSHCLLEELKRESEIQENSQ